MSPGFDPSDASPNRFEAYGLAPFPDPRDDELDEYIAALRRGGSKAIAAAIGSATLRGRRVLGAYAERTAVRAVRANDPSLLVSGLIALVIGGLYENDPEAQISMALIHDAAHRSGSEPEVVIKEAARIVKNPGKKYLMRWLSRHPWEQTLEVMKFEVGSDESGFRYVQKLL